eukprot:TRINITY_DN8480_c0_g1_i1.p1 TRINITY_DN8480_c0_g1~~TRINITY_DN8480_c0_g1_i1.p1  ORF type:complete len:420 (+),score=88.91 TRINITY_DN8480_c0_g1_i1:81-1340(+)
MAGLGNEDDDAFGGWHAIAPTPTPILVSNTPHPPRSSFRQRPSTAGVARRATLHKGHHAPRRRSSGLRGDDRSDRVASWFDAPGRQMTPSPVRLARRATHHGGAPQRAEVQRRGSQRQLPSGGSFMSGTAASHAKRRPSAEGPGAAAGPRGRRRWSHFHPARRQSVESVVSLPTPSSEVSWGTGDGRRASAAGPHTWIVASSEGYARAELAIAEKSARLRLGDRLALALGTPLPSLSRAAPSEEMRQLHGELARGLPRREAAARSELRKASERELNALYCMQRGAHQMLKVRAVNFSRIEACTKRQALERGRLTRLEEQQWQDCLGAERRLRALVAASMLKVELCDYGAPQVRRVWPPEYHLVRISGCPFKHPQDCPYFCSKLYNVGEEHRGKAVGELPMLPLPPDTELARRFGAQEGE